MVAFMNFILVKKGNKRKKIKKIAIYRKQNKKGLKQKRICADAFDEQSDGIKHYLCKQACLKTCLSTVASVPQSRISFMVVEKKEPNSFILYLFNN